MEFHNLGSHCSFPDCKQLDFLPFTCNACEEIFCLDHRTYEAHKCKFSDNKDRRALVCPICNNPIVALPSQDPNIVLDDHINQGCAMKASKGYKCNMKGCKKVDVVAIICKSCRRHHCVKHRWEDAHNCPRTQQPPKQKPAPTKQTTPTSSPPSTVNSNTNTNNSNSNQNRPQSVNNSNSNNNSYPGNQANNLYSNSNHSYNPPPSSSNRQNSPTYTQNRNTETTVGIRLTNGEQLRRTCTTTTTLRDIQLFIDQTRTDGSAPYIMRTTYPPRELSFSDLDKTMAQLGLVPSGMIILQPLQFEERAPNSQATNNATGSASNQNLGWWGTMSSFLTSFMPSSTQQ